MEEVPQAVVAHSRQTPHIPDVDAKASEDMLSVRFKKEPPATGREGVMMSGYQVHVESTHHYMSVKAITQHKY